MPYTSSSYTSLPACTHSFPPHCSSFPTLFCLGCPLPSHLLLLPSPFTTFCLQTWEEEGRIHCAACTQWERGGKKKKKKKKKKEKKKTTLFLQHETPLLLPPFSCQPLLGSCVSCYSLYIAVLVVVAGHSVYLSPTCRTRCTSACAQQRALRYAHLRITRAFYLLRTARATAPRRCLPLRTARYHGLHAFCAFARTHPYTYC